MGKLVYGMPSISVEFDDRALVHLKLVIAAKLRRGESFMFTWDYVTDDGPVQSSVWLHPSIPLHFEVVGTGDASVNREWLEQLMRSSNSPGGLRLVAEPVDGDSTPSKSTAPTKA